jgi:tetratricopeptide (TPR) repeat protein
MIRLNDEFIPPRGPSHAATAIPALVALLKNGDPAERQRALNGLVEARAETELTDCLRFNDQIAVQLATAGLWECWLNERGVSARQMMEEGIELMNAGHLVAASEIFLSLMKQYPDWAEAINKQATALYLSGKPAESMELCVKVVALKPNHFGAWNGMALCAVQLQDWQTALFAAKKALSIQPSAESNIEIIRMARSKLGKD